MADDIVITETNPHETRDKLAKLVLGTTAAFLANKFVESAYDAVVEWRRTKSEETN